MVVIVFQCACIIPIGDYSSDRLNYYLLLPIGRQSIPSVFIISGIFHSSSTTAIISHDFVLVILLTSLRNPLSMVIWIQKSKR